MKTANNNNSEPQVGINVASVRTQEGQVGDCNSRSAVSVCMQPDLNSGLINLDNYCKAGIVTRENNEALFSYNPNKNKEVAKNFNSSVYRTVIPLSIVLMLAFYGSILYGLVIAAIAVSIALGTSSVVSNLVEIDAPNKVKENNTKILKEIFGRDVVNDNNFDKLAKLYTEFNRFVYSKGGATENASYAGVEATKFLRNIGISERREFLNIMRPIISGQGSSPVVYNPCQNRDLSEIERVKIGLLIYLQANYDNYRNNKIVLDRHIQCFFNALNCQREELQKNSDHNNALNCNYNELQESLDTNLMAQNNRLNSLGRIREIVHDISKNQYETFLGASDPVNAFNAQLKRQVSAEKDSGNLNIEIELLFTVINDSAKRACDNPETIANGITANTISARSNCKAI